MTKSIAKKSTTGSLLPAVHLAITPTFSPWTHTSDDSYIYQLSRFSDSYCIFTLAHSLSHEHETRALARFTIVVGHRSMTGTIVMTIACNTITTPNALAVLASK